MTTALGSVNPTWPEGSRVDPPLLLYLRLGFIRVAGWRRYFLMTRAPRSAMQ